ncbi:hypothetical protein F4803DRAFT_174925 [Xylaria telfairii]|nr:hypothetical protein F4803DRAFT_174925 [Xylaria telfairii]
MLSRTILYLMYAHKIPLVSSDSSDLSSPTLLALIDTASGFDLRHHILLYLCISTRICPSLFGNRHSLIVPDSVPHTNHPGISPSRSCIVALHDSPSLLGADPAEIRYPVRITNRQNRLDPLSILGNYLEYLNNGQPCSKLSKGRLSTCGAISVPQPRRISAPPRIERPDRPQIQHAAIRQFACPRRGPYPTPPSALRDHYAAHRRPIASAHGGNSRGRRQGLGADPALTTRRRDYQAPRSHV